VDDSLIFTARGHPDLCQRIPAHRVHRAGRQAAYHRFSAAPGRPRAVDSRLCRTTRRAQKEGQGN